MKKIISSILLFASLFQPLAAQEVTNDSTKKEVDETFTQYMPTLKAGDKAPDFTTKTLDGRELKLADYRGKYLVIDFWATWCGDCRRESPIVAELFADVKDKKINEKSIEFLGLSFDNNRTSIDNYLEKHPLPWAQAGNMMTTREDPIFNTYQLHWIPAFFVIDPEGTIVGTAITGKGLRKVIESLF